jgi:hypothetical protein
MRKCGAIRSFSTKKSGALQELHKITFEEDTRLLLAELTILLVANWQSKNRSAHRDALKSETAFPSMFRGISVFETVHVFRNLFDLSFSCFAIGAEKIRGKAGQSDPHAKASGLKCPEFLPCLCSLLTAGFGISCSRSIGSVTFQATETQQVVRWMSCKCMQVYAKRLVHQLRSNV